MSELRDLLQVLVDEYGIDEVATAPAELVEDECYEGEYRATRRSEGRRSAGHPSLAP